MITILRYLAPVALAVIGAGMTYGPLPHLQLAGYAVLTLAGILQALLIPTPY